MNYKLAIYIKTFERDISRVGKLMDSIQRFNRDNIPVFISCSQIDRVRLEKELSEIEEWNYIPDEEIFEPTYRWSGWEHQMLVKMEAHKVIPADNILILDSDSFFIKDFYVDDFIAYDNIPYTIIHENKQVAEYETFLKNGKYSETGYAKAVRAYRDLFGFKSNRIYDYGPNPHLWNIGVMKSFYENYLQYNDLSLEEFCSKVKQQYNIHFRETLTYGEYLMGTKAMPIIPSGPLFKVYHWKELYDFELKNNMVEYDKIKDNYLGVVLQSNWL